MQSFKLMGTALLAAGLAACATQGAMTVDDVRGGGNPKYRNAMAVRSVGGGAPMDALTRPGVPNEPFKAALESSLEARGYLAKGAPRIYVDAEIQNLQQPLMGIDMDATATVTYKVSGAASGTYPITTTATAKFSDSPIGADRLRIANERAMQQNIRQFLQSLR